MQVLLIAGTFYLVWLLRPNPLSRTFLYRRLRLRGQLGMLLHKRKAWLFGLGLTTLESLGLALLGSFSYSLLVRHMLYCPARCVWGMQGLRVHSQLLFCLHWGLWRELRTRRWRTEAAATSVACSCDGGPECTACCCSG